MEERKVFIINKYEYGLLLEALNEYRTHLLKEGKSIDMVNRVLLKLINLPLKRKSIFKKEIIGYER